MSSVINFKRIIEEAYSKGCKELFWRISDNTFRTVRYPNAIIFLGEEEFIGSIYINDEDYSTRKFTKDVSEKMFLEAGEHKVIVSYLEDSIVGNVVVDNFSFYGKIPNYGHFYAQLMFKPIKMAYLYKLTDAVLSGGKNSNE